MKLHISNCTTKYCIRVSTGWDVPVSLCPGTKWVENFQIDQTRFSVLEHLFPVLDNPFLVLEHLFPVLERPFLLCPILSRVPSRILAVPACPVLNFGCPGPSRPLVRFLACSVVPLSWDKEETSVPLSRKVALSCPVGNPIHTVWGF